MYGTATENADEVMGDVQRMCWVCVLDEENEA